MTECYKFWFMEWCYGGYGELQRCDENDAQWFLVFSLRQSTARHAVVGNGMPPIRAEPFAWSYKHVLGSRGAAARSY